MPKMRDRVWPRGQGPRSFVLIDFTFFPLLPFSRVTYMTCEVPQLSIHAILLATVAGDRCDLGSETSKLGERSEVGEVLPGCFTGLLSATLYRRPGRFLHRTAKLRPDASPATGGGKARFSRRRPEALRPPVHGQEGADHRPADVSMAQAKWAAVQYAYFAGIVSIGITITAFKHVYSHRPISLAKTKPSLHASRNAVSGRR